MRVEDLRGTGGSQASNSHTNSSLMCLAPPSSPLLIIRLVIFALKPYEFRLWLYISASSSRLNIHG
ncbi:hypothetical protein DRO37_02840 [Candidatus Bathyarchaeota archaeon]|nr:MAG: hypothetical protein DRO37_02840 [Candidatus Bathyarchaeota archaeon]